MFKKKGTKRRFRKCQAAQNFNLIVGLGLTGLIEQSLSARAQPISLQSDVAAGKNLYITHSDWASFAAVGDILGDLGNYYWFLLAVVVLGLIGWLITTILENFELNVLNLRKAFVKTKWYTRVKRFSIDGKRYEFFLDDEQSKKVVSIYGRMVDGRTFRSKKFSIKILAPEHLELSLIDKYEFQINGRPDISSDMFEEIFRILGYRWFVSVNTKVDVKGASIEIANRLKGSFRREGISKKSRETKDFTLFKERHTLSPVLNGIGFLLKKMWELGIVGLLAVISNLLSRGPSCGCLYKAIKKSNGHKTANLWLRSLPKYAINPERRTLIYFHVGLEVMDAIRISRENFYVRLIDPENRIWHIESFELEDSTPLMNAFSEELIKARDWVGMTSPIHHKLKLA